MVGSAAIKQGRSANHKHTYFFFWPNMISFIPINPFGTNRISITFDTVRSGWYIIQ